MEGTGKNIIDRLNQGETIDLRADGKAGCGLVMILQTFAEAASHSGTWEAQEWPLFSSARKGANVRGFLRIAKGPITITCQVEAPEVALLVTEKTGDEIDFAQGMTGGLFVINTPRSPEEISARLGLTGQVFTVPGDALGQTYLGHPIPNISVLAALHKALPLVSAGEIVEALRRIGEKRRLPPRMIEANENCFVASHESVRSAEGRDSNRHPLPAFEGYRHYTIGAQGRLRTSLANKTGNYAPAGRHLLFHDPEGRCNGCSLCIVNCPEGIITFQPSEKTGIRVTGALVDQFCKLCRECVEVCPLDLFEVGTR